MRSGACGVEPGELGGVVLLEHVNLNIGESVEAFEEAFYWWRDEVGLTLDPEHRDSRTLWFNVGPRAQIHLPRREPVQRVQGSRGCLTLAVPWAREERSVLDGLGGTRVVLQASEAGRGGYVREVKMGARPEALGCIAAFWRVHFGAEVTQTATAVSVGVGDSQRLVFYAEEEEGERHYTGWHVCIYLAQFERAYESLRAQGLIHARHSFSDKCATLEEARAGHQFRARDVPDAQGATVFQLELEVRALSHPAFRQLRHARK